MLAEVLAVFVLGIAVGQALKFSGRRPSLWAGSAVAASALLFSLGLSIGLGREALLSYLPEVLLVSVLLGVSTALVSGVVALLVRRKRP